MIDFKSQTFDLPLHLSDPTSINKHFLELPGGADTNRALIDEFRSSTFNTSVFTFQHVSESTVNKIIKSITSSAIGDDNINLDMITLTLPHTLNVITAIINKSLETGIFPQQWKCAKVKPIPKTQHPNEFKDLRPISILPFLSKILEAVVCSQITSYLELNHILPEKQSGFRKSGSTATALSDVVDDILAAQDVGESSLLVLLDFSRAFDTINIEVLLAKMAFYGFDSNALNWFSSYLVGRTQFVETCSITGVTAVSDIYSTKRGIPQGSKLGPILFILYTADIIKNIVHCKYHLYADDLQLYISFKPEDTDLAVDRLNADLERLSQWSDQNNLVLNPKKTKVMVLGSKNIVELVTTRDPAVVIRGERLQRVREARNLGLVVDERLQFEKHVAELMRNCFYRLKVLYRIRDCISTNMRVKLCETLILSKLNYVDTVFGSCLLARTKRVIQRIQNACTRYCFTVPKYSHISPFINHHNLLNMTSRRTLHFATLLFGIINSRQPSYLFNKLEFSQRGVRVAPRLLCPRHKTAAFRGSFRYAASKCWNDLPPPVRCCKTVATFKLKLRQHLLNEQKC